MRHERLGTSREPLLRLIATKHTRLVTDCAWQNLHSRHSALQSRL